MHVLMLVATPVATDTRVLREARSLTVEGDWTFSDPVTVVGDAVLADAGEPRVVDDEVIGRR